MDENELGDTNRHPIRRGIDVTIARVEAAVRRFGIAFPDQPIDDSLGEIARLRGVLAQCGYSESTVRVVLGALQGLVRTLQGRAAGA